MRAAGVARVEGIGAVTGVLFLAALFATDAEHASVAVAAFGDTALALVLETAGPLLLGYAIAGAVTAFVRPSNLDWIGRGGALSQSARGMLVGLPVQVCSCGVVPVYRALIQRGVPASAAMAFLIATPEFGLDAITLSLPMLGFEMTVVRLVAAAIVALTVGWVVGRLVPQPEPVENKYKISMLRSTEDQVKVEMIWEVFER